jgi:hypothetical protein
MARQMKTELLTQLAPVRLRMRLQSVVRAAGIGALAGCQFLLVCGILRAVFHIEISGTFAALVFSASVMIGTICGWLLNCSWSAVASRVDRHYQFKDRTTTALQLSDHPQPSIFEQLQLQDAAQHLQDINAADVVPLAPPQRWQWTVLLLLVSGRLWMAPIVGDEPSQPELTPQQTAVVVADIQNEIDDLEALAEEAANEELEQLVANLRQDVKHLKIPALTVRDSMKTVSEMQQRIKDLMQDMDIAAMDAELRNVGEAIAGAKPFKLAAAAIEEGDLEKAAAELQDLTEEELSPDKMKPAESRPTAEKLAEAAKAAKEKGLDELSEQLSELSEAVKSGEAKQTAEKAEDLAQTIKEQGVKRKLNNLLQNKSDQLGLSKKQLAVQSQSEGEGSMAGKGQNLKKGKSEKSENDIASQKAGGKSAGNINGPKTQLESERQMARLTGQLSEDGDSETETETTAAPETPQQAQRKAQEAYNRYQKMSEAVLDSESIPVGHRETIRRYFELIRPSKDETGAADTR